MPARVQLSEEYVCFTSVLFFNYIHIHHLLKIWIFHDFSFLQPKDLGIQKHFLGIFWVLRVTTIIVIIMLAVATHIWSMNIPNVKSAKKRTEYIDFVTFWRWTEARDMTFLFLSFVEFHYIIFFIIDCFDEHIMRLQPWMHLIPHLRDSITQHRIKHQLEISHSKETACDTATARDIAHYRIKWDSWGVVAIHNHLFPKFLRHKDPNRKLKIKEQMKTELHCFCLLDLFFVRVHNKFVGVRLYNKFITLQLLYQGVLSA